MAGPDILAGKAEFDELRANLSGFETDVSRIRLQALGSLNRASDELNVTLLVIAIGLAVVVTGLAVVLRAAAIRPVHRLAAEARRVADGDFEHAVAPAGPREVRDLAAADAGPDQRPARVQPGRPVRAGGGPGEL